MSFETLFNLRFTAKRLHKDSIREEKKSEREKKKVLAALKSGNKEKAEILAGNAIRMHKQSIQLLHLSSKIDAIREKIEQQKTMGQINKVLQKSAIAMNKELSKELNPQKLMQLMQKFGEQEEDLEVKSMFIDEMISPNAQPILDSEVQDLIAQATNETSQKLPEVPNLPEFPSLDGLPEIDEKAKNTEKKPVQEANQLK
ncbi:charged multivesicular body protein 1b [Anaeramoeba ignava]|uniref:Charged multivesicular body protein 1b n=1 Tax=Anaeramoeba ignava TaxID=1746090 RepID=A0A9Q0LGL2_ANAIG|nr:charged multivesicular body protein 1b [Anaeramoeba ignava]